MNAAAPGGLAHFPPAEREAGLASHTTRNAAALNPSAQARQRGTPVLFLSSDAAASPTSVGADAEPALELLSMLARFYVLASAGALRRGRSPDTPPMLSKVTETR